MNRIKKEEYKGVLLAFLLASGLIYLSLSAYFMLAAVPFVLVYAVARGGYAGAVAAVLSFAAAAYFDLSAALNMAGAFLPVAFAAGYMIRAKKRFRDSVVVSIGAVFAGAALVIAIPMLTGGAQPVDRIVSWAQRALNAMGDKEISTLYQAVRYIDVMTGAITQQALVATPSAEAAAVMLGLLRDTLNIWFITITGIYSLLTGLLCCVIPRAAAKRSMDLAPAPAFGDYALPKRFWLAYASSYLFAITGDSLGWKSFDIIGLTVYNLYAFVFSVQALSFFDHMYKKRGMGAGSRTMLHVVTTIVLSFVLVWVGIFENIFGLRKRMEAGPTKGS